jgi:hypothetical protein
VSHTQTNTAIRSAGMAEIEVKIERAHDACVGGATSKAVL